MVSDLEAFEAWLREQDRSEVTVRGYLADMRQFARWFAQTHDQELRVDGVTPTDVREYRGWLQTVRRASAATIRRRLMALRSYCRWGVAVGRVESDPTARLKIPREEPLSPRWLERGEQWRLVREAERGIQAANTPQRRRLAVRDWSLVVFLLNTGLRVSEACAIDVSDVQMGERSGWVQVRSGKGAKARKVPLNAEARRALKAWLEARGDAPGRLFGITVSVLQRRLAEIGRRAGVEVHPHTLRHTMAKNLVDAGVGLHEVATLLGHSSLNATRVYITPGERDLERALERIAE